MKTNKRNLLFTLPIISFILCFFTACEKEDENITVTDIDGNVYTTVKIGSQVWMVENLKVTKYNDGTSIPLVTDDTEWAGMTTDAFCWYENSVTANKNTYGAMYNWYAVNTGKLCPEGWHVPTDAEWTTLAEFLGGDTIAGGKLKSVGTVENNDGLWHEPNTGASDEFGFSAMPGGGHYYNGVFGWMGHYGTYWTSTESTSNGAWTRYMRYNSKALIRDQYAKKVGYSVRCIKD